MEMTVQRKNAGKDYEHTPDTGNQPLIIMEPGGLDYACAVVLLRNIGERRETTSLEREALAAAIRVLQRDTGAKKQ